MWYMLANVVLIFMVISYFLGYMFGKRKCMNENDILYGKNAKRFLKAMKEKETGILYGDSFIEKSKEKRITPEKMSVIFRDNFPNKSPDVFLKTKN